jgi:hypothetical protein
MSRKSSSALLLFNCAGVAIYLLRASHSWAMPQERGLHATTGEPFVWALGVLPVWLVFGLLNLIWGTFILARRKWGSGSLWFVAASIWLIAVWVDFAHH